MRLTLFLKAVFRVNYGSMPVENERVRQVDGESLTKVDTQQRNLAKCNRDFCLVGVLLELLGLVLVVFVQLY